MNAKRARHGTRSLILQTALEILCVSGFAGVTFGSLARRIGMSKSGLFAHFKSIEQVHLALVVYAYEVFRANVISAEINESKGISELSGTISRWLNWASQPYPPAGSPLLAAFFEFDDREGAIRDALLGLELQWRAHLARLVQSTIEGGAFRADLDARQFVAELCGVTYNLQVSLNFLRDKAAPEIAKRTVETLMATAMNLAGGT
jgi:AcrR family transcriptional regulator